MADVTIGAGFDADRAFARMLEDVKQEIRSRHSKSASPRVRRHTSRSVSAGAGVFGAVVPYDGQGFGPVVKLKKSREVSS